jgi:PAS domain S-box-containing protein
MPKAPHVDPGGFDPHSRGQLGHADDISDAVLRTLAEESPDAVVVVDAQGRLCWVNGQVERLFGYSRAELLGQPVEVLLPDGAHETHQAHRSGFIEQRRTRPMGIGLDLEARRHDGSTFPVEISLTPLSTDTGDMVIATVWDITERKAFAEARVELTRFRDIAEIVSLHRDLTTAASSGEGLLGIARALERAVNWPVVIEDPDGTVLAWTESLKAEPTFPPSPERRQRLSDAHHAEAFRHGPRLIAVARPDHQLLGVISLVDPDAGVGEPERIALEQAATVLAMELFRLRSVAETEVAVWGDLASELLDDDNVSRSRSHAQALGYDIDRFHRAVLVMRTEPKVGELIPAVRRATRRFDMGVSLMTSRAAGVVILLDHDLPWDAFAAAVAEENGGVHRIGIGGFRAAGDFRRSLAEAETALEITDRLGGGDVVANIEDLGVWRLLAGDADPSALTDFVRQWIGALIDYDSSHGADLTKTLATYLNNDRAYEATASRLLIHRSTLRYRLGRIGVLSGWDLGDPEHRFNLDLACRAWITLSSHQDHSDVETPSPGDSSWSQI